MNWSDHHLGTRGVYFPFPFFFGVWGHAMHLSQRRKLLYIPAYILEF